MVMIRVKDHVASASTYEDGEIIFRLLEAPLMRGEPIDVSFQGISSVPSAFINAAFVRLLERATFDQLRQSLHIVESTKSINELLRSRIEFVAGAKGHHVS